MPNPDVFSDYSVSIFYRQNSRVNDIIGAVFRPVFDYPFPYFSGLYGLPYVLERLCRHIGMPDYVVRFAK